MLNPRALPIGVALWYVISYGSTVANHPGTKYKYIQAANTAAAQAIANGMQSGTQFATLKGPYQTQQAAQAAVGQGGTGSPAPVPPHTSHTKTAARSIDPLTQPPFDPRITDLTFPMTSGAGSAGNGKLARGYMIWDKAIFGYASRARVNFLFNPTTIAISFGLMNDSKVSAGMLYRQPADKAKAYVPMQQGVSFSLLYDRTYELWSHLQYTAAPMKGYLDPVKIGAKADFMAIQQFTGCFATEVDGTGNSIISAAGDPTNHFKQQGPMVPIPAWVYFGDATAGTHFFYGWVDSWDWTTTHWTQDMIPMRGVANINFTMLPPPKGELTAGSGANPYWSMTTTPGSTSGTPGKANPGGPITPGSSNSPSGKAGR